MGSLGAATNKDALNSKNITHILTVADSLPPSYPNDFVYEVIGGMCLPTKRYDSFSNFLSYSLLPASDV